MYHLTTKVTQQLVVRSCSFSAVKVAKAPKVRMPVRTLSRRYSSPTKTFVHLTHALHSTTLTPT
ncbi:hypothetical protein M3J09_009704 [Ascochyta lentis]